MNGDGVGENDKQGATRRNVSKTEYSDRQHTLMEFSSIKTTAFVHTSQTTLSHNNNNTMFRNN